MSTPNNNLQDLNKEELKNTTGGSILGGDDNSGMIQTQGYVSISQTDENGDTSSTDLSYGNGSMFQNESE